MSDEKLVTMVKEGEEPIDVHPSVVKAHEAVGWKVAEPEAEAAESTETKAKAKPGTRTRARVKKTEEESDSKEDAGE